MNYVILVYEIEFFISSKYKYGIMAYGGGGAWGVAGGAVRSRVILQLLMKFDFKQWLTKLYQCIFKIETALYSSILEILTGY